MIYIYLLLHDAAALELRHMGTGSRTEVIKDMTKQQLNTQCRLTKQFRYLSLHDQLGTNIPPESFLVPLILSRLREIHTYNMHVLK